MILFSALVSLGLLVGCGIPSMTHRERMEVTDPKVSALWNMGGMDRGDLGLMPLPESGSVVISQYKGGDPKGAGYDTLLTYDEATATVEMAFSHQGGRLRWIGEHDTYYGPKEYDTADGVQRERIVVSYWQDGVRYTQPGLRIQYDGDDEELAALPLTIGQLKSKLREWAD